MAGGLQRRGKSGVGDDEEVGAGEVVEVGKSGQGSSSKK